MSDNPSPPTTQHVCSRFHRAIELIGSRWTGAILQTLLQGSTRYAVIKAAIPDITDLILSERLRSLEAEDLVSRQVIAESLLCVEYDLTIKDRKLQSALRELGSWAVRWIPLDDPWIAHDNPDRARRKARTAKSSSV